MRMLLRATMPNDPFNTAVRDGTAGNTLKRIVEDAKAEAVYFTEFDGLRTAIVIVDIKDASQIPAFAEPWFLNFKATVEFHPVMSPDDLGRAGLEALAKKWG